MCGAERPRCRGGPSNSPRMGAPAWVRLWPVLTPSRGLDVCSSRGPAGPALKNPASESVRLPPGDMCLYVGPCVLDTRVLKLGLVSPDPTPIPGPAAGSASRSRCDGSEPEDTVPGPTALLLEPSGGLGTPTRACFGDNQPFTVRSSRWMRACRWPQARASRVASLGPGGRLVDRCCWKPPRPVPNRILERGLRTRGAADVLPGRIRRCDGSGDGGQAGLQRALPCPAPVTQAGWGPRELVPDALRAQTPRGQLLLEPLPPHTGSGVGRGGGLGTAGLRSLLGPVGGHWGAPAASGSGGWVLEAMFVIKRARRAGAAFNKLCTSFPPQGASEETALGRQLRAMGQAGAGERCAKRKHTQRDPAPRALRSGRARGRRFTRPGQAPSGSAAS